MIDIVNGLRRIAEEGYRFAGDAADEIERLRASLEAAEKERDNANAAAENIALKLDYLRSKLETAKNAQNDWLRANAPGGWIDNLRVENEALRAKVAEIGQQEPVAEIVSFGCHDLKEVAWKKGKMPALGSKLYALPGAQTQGEEK